MNINIDEYSFYERYGLADIIINYCELTKNITEFSSIVNILTTITEPDIINFYQTVYKDLLFSKLHTKHTGVENNYSYINIPEKSNKAGDGSYLSCHVMLSGNGGDWKIIYDNTSTLKSQNNVFSGDMRTSPFKKQFQESTELLVISSNVATLTPNKFCVYNGTNTSYIPDYINFVDVLKYLYNIRNYVINLNYGKLFESSTPDKVGKFNRPNIFFKGNFPLCLKNDTLGDRFLDILMELEFIESVEFKNKRDKTKILNWYCVSNDDVKLMRINSLTSELINLKGSQSKQFFDDFLYYEKNDKNLINYDKSKKSNEVFQKFIKRFDWFTLQKLLVNDNIQLTRDNDLLNLFINTKLNINDMENGKDIIIDMTECINNQLYFKSKQYYKKTKGIDKDESLSYDDKKYINERKLKMRKEICNMLDRSIDLIEFINYVGKFFDKHSIQSFFDVDKVLTLNGENYPELKKLIYIYLITNKK